MEMTPTVFVVDEDPLGRSAVRQSAGTLSLHCEEFASGSEFIESLDPSRPGCVVLESRLPGLSGIEIQQRLIAQAPTLPVVFITRHATISAAVRAMRAGAVHVLEKPVREVELWDALQEAIQVNSQRRQLVHQRGEAQRRLVQLTPKEMDVMKAVTSGATNAAMASRFGVSQRTIELRRAKMMKKLEVRSLAELVRLVMSAEDACPADAPSGELLKASAHSSEWLAKEARGGNGVHYPAAWAGVPFSEWPTV